MQTTYTTAKDTTRKTGGRKVRVWIEGQKLLAAGFTPNARYDIAAEGRKLTLTLAADGARKVTGSTRNGKPRPIIDLNSAAMAAVFAPGDRIQVTFSQGCIIVEPHHEATDQEQRETDITTNLAAGKVTTATMFCGGGISTEASHDALQSLQIDAQTRWVAEAEVKYLESAGENCHAITDDTAFILGTVEEAAPHLFTSVDVLSISMPCAGFSNAGRVKHKKDPIAHSGTALFGVINAIRSANPAVIVSENVVEAKNSPIYALLRAELDRRGYDVQEHVLDSSHTDTLENRRRYWLVATSRGLDVAALKIPLADASGRTVADILDGDDVTADMWADNQYLKDKAVRDADAGKGFANRQLLDGSEERVGTIGRHYIKRRSTEPFVTRADGKERLFTPSEHARLKSVPERLIAGLSATRAHEVLGQSVDYLQPFKIIRALFEGLTPCF